MLNAECFDYINIVIAWIMCFFCMVSVGTLLTKALQFESLLHLELIWGTVGILAFGEVLYLCCLAIDLRFDIYFYIFCTGVFLVSIISMIISITNHSFFNFFGFKWDKSYILGYLILIIFLSSSILLKWGNTGDDEFYLGKIEEIIFSQNINPVQPAAAGGMIENGNYYRADASSMIVLFACISKLLSIHPVIVARTVIPPVIMIIGYCVIKEMACSIFDNHKQQRDAFVVSLAILLWVKNDSAYQAETFLIKYPWYGIVIMTLFVYLFISQVARLYIDNELVKRGYYWVRIALINLAILQCEIVAPFIILCMFISYGVPFMYSHRILLKTILKGSFFSLISVLICSIYVLKVYYSHTILAGSEINRSWKEIVYGYFFYGKKGITLYFLLFVLSFVYFAIKGNGNKKFIFVYPVIILAMTFANPLLFKYVSTYITSKDAYYRIFFVLPIFFIVASFASEMMYVHRRWGHIAMLTALIIICVTSFTLLCPERTTNSYKADEKSLQFISDLHKEYCKQQIYVVPCADSEKIHIYDYNIKYICSRYSSLDYIQGTKYTYSSLYSAACNKDLKAFEVIERLGADCVIYDKDEELSELEHKYFHKIVGEHKIVYLNR